MKSYSIREGDIDKKWVLVDAEGVVLGRLASHVAKILRGKHKATFTPHMDMGDNVIVINAEKVQLTGTPAFRAASSTAPPARSLRAASPSG